MRKYSKGAIEFILRWNVEICEPNGYDKLLFDSKWEPNPEYNEIFLLGLHIYKVLTGQNAYQGVHLFNPIESTPARHICKVNPDVDKDIGDIVMKMIASSGKRYEVFTEITKEMAKIREK